MTTTDGIKDALVHGELEIEGRLSGASNATLRAVSSLDGVDVVCVYKPRRGERPLWDFPSGSLGEREVAAFQVADALGWDLIPLTVWREEGPFGPGMCQQWIEADDTKAPVEVVEVDEPSVGITVAEGEGYGGSLVRLVHEDAPDLRRLSLLDVIVNNADRKGGHVLRDGSGRLFGIDHGLTFHEEDKLRTVLWGWAGEQLAAADRADLEAAVRSWDHLAVMLHELLAVREVRATRERIDALLLSGVHPEPVGAWPALPWPAM